ncbi:WW domain-containing protein [Meloidogyne graminicola]|uniref:WW domain-containing protein n=1 Tax=Meloidogyne graminicola TaxID=189291 RepID=A0A8S9ZHW6_9BILA|nr:WW domain-containing protein [Meloidogyne graminicola]
MPTSSLPPLLLQKLQRRGIVQDEKKEEEVFAENYDQEDNTKVESTKEKHRGGAPGCPNKHILFHVCTDYCFDHWQEGYPESRLSERYLEQRKKMLRNYPLPEGWTEIYDSGMCRHYYWNQNTDEVSWLSPKHPKAVISESAPKIAREMWNLSSHKPEYVQNEGINERGRNRSERGRDKRRERETRHDRRSEMALAKRGRATENDSDEDARPIVELTDRDKLKRAKRRGIDPMDPSAYGEAPEGAWTSGLREDQEVKTGVDVTASGPLFQQRPYPAPGAILRRMHPDKYPQE